jgi:hypothetical protein
MDSVIEKHVNIKELFNFSRLHVDDMASILQDLDLVGSTTGLTIANIRDRYSDYSLESTLIWITRYVVIGLTVIGLVGVAWFLRKKYLKAKKDTRPLLIRFRELFSSDKTPRDHEMQERGDRSDSDENMDFLGVGFVLLLMSNLSIWGKPPDLLATNEPEMIYRMNCGLRHGFEPRYIINPPHQVQPAPRLDILDISL